MSKSFRSELVQLVVDDLIAKAMHYNETLYSHYSFAEFDAATRRLCLARRKLITWLKRL